MFSPERDRSKKFHWRGLTSFLVTLGFLLLAFTGMMLYFTPKGGVAHWIDLRLLGLDKDQWAAIHMLAAILFVIAAGFHLYFNWRIFIHYIKTKAGFNLKRETSTMRPARPRPRGAGRSTGSSCPTSCSRSSTTTTLRARWDWN